MKLSPAGVHLIAGFEGYRARAYLDGPAPGGNCTIGFGHLLRLGGCTAADDALVWDINVATAHLAADTAYYAEAVTKAVKVRLGIVPSYAQARFDALCSLCYNIGVGAFGSSSLLRAINKQGAPRDWMTLGPLWLAWSYADGRPELLSRRKAEFAIFAAGKYPCG